MSNYTPGTETISGDAYSRTARLIRAAPEMMDAGEAMADAYRQLLAIHYGDTKNVCPTLKEWDAVVRKVAGEAAEGASK